MAPKRNGHPGSENRSSEEIYREIDETRDEMDHTLDEIGERLHPKHLIDQFVGLFASDDTRESESTRRTRQTAKQLMRKVKQHPVPALLCGGGLAWLLLEDEHDRRQPKMRRQWDDLEEHGESAVDARTGEPYADDYGAPYRGAAAWHDEFDWSDTHEDQESWNRRAEATLEEIQQSLSDSQASAREKIRSSAAKLVAVSGRRRSEIHAQWDDIAEHSGSFVDARTGEPYDESYGQQWRNLACCDIAASEELSEEDEERLSETAQQSIARMQQSISDTGKSTKQRLEDVSEQLSGFVTQAQSVSSNYGKKARQGLRRAAGASQRGLARAGRASRRGVSATRHSAVSGYQNTRDYLGDAMEQSPLAVGAAVLGAGLIAGLLVPRTRREDRWMGSTADRVKRQATDAGEEALQRGRQVAESAGSAAMDEMEQQGITPDQIGEQAREAGGRFQEVARETMPEPETVRQKVEKVAQRTAETAEQEAQQQTEEAQSQRDS